MKLLTRQDWELRTQSAANLKASTKKHKDAAGVWETLAEKDREAKAREANKNYQKNQREREESERKVRKELLEPVAKQLAGLLAKGDLAALKLLTRQDWELRTQSAANLKASTKKYKDAAGVWENLAEKVVLGCVSYSSLHSMTAARKGLEKLTALAAIQLPAEDAKPAKKKAAARGKQKKAAA